MPHILAFRRETCRPSMSDPGRSAAGRREHRLLEWLRLVRAVPQPECAPVRRGSSGDGPALPGAAPDHRTRTRAHRPCAPWRAGATRASSVACGPGASLGAGGLYGRVRRSRVELVLRRRLMDRSRIRLATGADESGLLATPSPHCARSACTGSSALEVGERRDAGAHGRGNRYAFPSFCDRMAERLGGEHPSHRETPEMAGRKSLPRLPSYPEPLRTRSSPLV